MSASAPAGAAADRGDFLSTSLRFVRGVGPRRAADLERVGLRTVEDLLLRFPLRYENRAELLPISALRPGRTATVVGEVLSSGLRSTRRPGFRLFELLVKDATGPIRAVFPNQAFLRDVFHPQQQVVLFGPLEYRGSGLQFTNPEYEIIRGDADDDDATVHTGRIVPIYEKAGSVTPRMQRTLMHQVLAGSCRPSSPIRFPPPIRARRAACRIARRRSSRRTFRRPGTDIAVLNAFRSPAQQRLIFEEFFLFQAGLVLRKRRQRPTSASRARSSSTIGFASRRAACCRSS